MRIEFDPTNPTEAAAVRAMLTAMAPTPDFTSLNEPIADYLSQVVGVAREELELAKEDAEKYAGHETDSTGTPWDERIHSTPATTNKDGTWRAKRGVTAELIAQVRAEREHYANLSATAEELIAQVRAEREHYANLSATAEELIEQAQPLELPTEAPTAPPAPPAPPVTPAPPAPAGQSESPAETAHIPPAPIATGAPSFLDVMKAITAAQKDGKIDTAKVKELCAAVGAGESTMGLNGPDNGDKRVAFMALLAEETK